MVKFAFVIPSTTNKRDDWKRAEDTYLWTILCSSLEKYTPDIGDRRIKLFIGYDFDDRIYSIEKERLKLEEELKYAKGFLVSSKNEFYNLREHALMIFVKVKKN